MRLLSITFVILGISSVILDVGRVSARMNIYDNVHVWSGYRNDVAMTITVINRGHRIIDINKELDRWWEWGNTSTDVYLFDFHYTEGVDIVIDFSIDAERPKASVYTITDVEGESLQVTGEGYAMASNIEPELIVWSQTMSWLEENKANFDLEVWQRESNGLEWEYRVKSLEPGIPAWFTGRLISDTNPMDGIPRFYAAVRADRNVKYEMAEPLMPSWPYLSVGKDRDHFGKVRPIFYDMDDQELIQIWSGFHTAGMYQVNSLSYPPDVDFEAPFAFYQFDPDAGQYANLVIRSDIWPESSPFGYPMMGLQRTAMRMTWKVEDYKLWRYSISVIGNHAPDDVVVIGEDVFVAVPYDALPYWINEREWKAITFVEATQGESGSEGIYDFSVEDNYSVSSWVNGEQGEEPDTFSAPFLEYATIDPRRLKVHMRGEYSLDYNRSPKVYYSPVDNRLHLLYAEGGLWNLGDRRVLRVHNLNEDPYIDGWTREEVGHEPEPDSKMGPRAVRRNVEESLYHLGDHVIYSGPQGSEVSKVDLTPSMFEDAPPSDRTTWQSYVDRMSAVFGTERDPHDLRSWVRALGGTRELYTTGGITDVQVVEDGFRFVVELNAGFLTSVPQLRRLPPGRYYVHYDGQFRATPSIPPRPRVTVLAQNPHQFEATRLQLELRNDGLEDLTSMTLELWSSSPEFERSLLITRTVSLLALAPTTLNVDWQPSLAGEWHLEPRLVAASGEITTFTPTVITVSPVAPVDGIDILAVSISPLLAPLMGLCLTFAVFISIVIATHQCRREV